MARLASVVIRGLPHSIAHCGNHWQQTCFDDGDRSGQNQRVHAVFFSFE
jgi:hypothetical protein